MLRRLIDEGGAADPQAPLFTSATGRRLTRFGIYKRVRQHAARLESAGGTPHTRRITPHAFRHTTAVHLLESGVEVNVIRGWLGHVSLETTNRYAEITVKMKQAALKLCEPLPLTEGSAEGSMENRRHAACVAGVVVGVRTGPAIVTIDPDAGPVEYLRRLSLDQEP